MKQRVALVTGAGGGIGSEISLALGRAGFAIAVNDIDPQAAERTVARLHAAASVAGAYVADVGDAASVDGMLQDIERDLGPVCVLVNNAGNPGRFSLLVDMDEAVWNQTLRVHLTGAFLLLRACARRMIPLRWGRVVNVASLAGVHGTIGSGEYGAAKAGLINLTKTAAKELGPFGITVNAIAPGMVATPVNRALEEKGSGFIRSSLEGVPTGRMVEPAEIAALVAFLAGEAAGNISGVTTSLDGGASISLTMDRFMREHLTAKSAFLKGV